MTVSELIESLRAMPRGKLVEICVKADDPEGDEEPTNKDDLYVDAQSVRVLGDVVVIAGS